MTTEQDFQSAMLGFQDRQTVALEQMAEDVHFLRGFVNKLALVIPLALPAESAKDAPPVVHAPQSSPTPPPATSELPTGDMATVEQIGTIYAIGRERGKNREQINEVAKKRFNGRIPDQLTKAEAQTWIISLKQAAKS